jgi:hypothetical protein
VTDNSGRLRAVLPPGKRRISAAALDWGNGFKLPEGYELVKENTEPVELLAGKTVKLRFEFRKK